MKTIATKIRKIIKLSFLSSLIFPFLISTAFAAGCNVGTFSSVPPPGDASNVVIDSVTPVLASGSIPSYCDVKGRIDSTSTSVIHFEVRLPSPWNNRLYMLGNGGLAGSITTLGVYDLQAFALNYAIAQTDTGHVGGSNPIWALNNPLGMINFGYRATHLTAVLAKNLIMSYYGQLPQHSYFNSCSNGGRMGLMEAQRYPNDFEGIIVGHPAADITGTVLKFVQNAQAQYPDGNFNNPTVPLSKLNLLTTTVLNKCDALDGISDGFINDPSKCNFRPKNDLPKCSHDKDGPTCFTSMQIDALAAIYDDVKAANGQSYPGSLPGLENDPSSVGWTSYIFGSPSLISVAANTTAHPAGLPSREMFFAEAIFDNMVTFKNLTQPVSYLDFDINDKQDVADLLVTAPILNSLNPDLSDFKQHNGKLIIYQGWNDPIVSPLGTIAYYKAVTQNMQGLNKTQDFARLFMIPGTVHCSNTSAAPTGPGPNRIQNLIPTIQNWVENGVAPDQMIGVNPVSGLSRPLCPYPEIAVLNDGLDANNPAITNVAANFHCVKNQPQDIKQ